MMPFSFKKILPDGFRIFAFIGDSFTCAISLFLAKHLFDLVGPLIGKPPVAFEPWQYFKEHGLFLITIYAFLNYFLSGIKLCLNRSWKLGVLSLGFNTGLYLIWISYEFEKRGFSLKTFFTFLFFVLFTLSAIWQCFILEKILRMNWEIWLPPFLLKTLRRWSAYFKEKPSSIFVIVFMILLIVCASLMALDQELMAEELANWAYFALVIGVLTELIQVVRNRRQDPQG